MTDTGGLQQQHAAANGTATATADGAATSPRLQRASSASLKRRTGCFLIGIAGGTASGKTTVCHKIMDRLQDQCARLIHQDSFYRGLTPEELRNVKCECWQLAVAGSSVHAVWRPQHSLRRRERGCGCVGVLSRWLGFTRHLVVYRTRTSCALVRCLLLCPGVPCAMLCRLQL